MCGGKYSVDKLTKGWLICKWVGPGQCDISSHDSEWHAFKNLWIVYFLNFPFNIFRAWLTMVTKTVDSEAAAEEGLLYSQPYWWKTTFIILVSDGWKSGSSLDRCPGLGTFHKAAGNVLARAAVISVLSWDGIQFQTDLPGRHNINKYQQPINYALLYLLETSDWVHCILKEKAIYRARMLPGRDPWKF